MKFNERLIELRKKEGLSQEELGYKLNVTRQTVSKWELGQTTPEMDKLLEMSKLFNISVDELINESETTDDNNPISDGQTIKDQPIEKESNNNNKVIIIIVAVIVTVLVLAAVAFFNIFNKMINLPGKMMDEMTGFLSDGYNEMTGIIGSTSDGFNEMAGFLSDGYNEMKDMIDVTDMEEEISTTRFNISIEAHSGIRGNDSVVSLLEKIITSNKKNNRKITVKYIETETQDVDKIKEIKLKINKASTSDEFDVSCEYDDNGYIYEVKIERL